MFADKIVVKSTDDDVFIELPRNDKVVGFYDMYYVNECICVIVATRGAYDIRYVLDEEEYTLISEQLSKWNCNILYVVNKV